MIALAMAFVGFTMQASAASQTTNTSPTYDITTLAGKVASLAGTAGLQIRFSAFVEQEADTSDSSPNPSPGTPITPTFVLSSPLDGSAIAAPGSTVNQDTAGAPQNEPVIAVDPTNSNRLVAGMNDYATRTWTCSVGSTPCSALGDGYSGTYYSNDGGLTWCCTSSDPSNIGTLIPGVEHLVGGSYDAGGDPVLAFDAQGNVYFTGLGFDRTSPPNTVTLSKGTFDANGALTWGAPTFINPSTSPAIFNDKPWLTVDTHASSSFQGRVYATWTRFLFNPVNGRYVQSPIAFVSSSDGGATFTNPQLVVGNVLYDQGSRVVTGPDGTVYVFWEGSTRLATFNSIWMTSSSDGGATWSKPTAIAPVVDVIPPFKTAFRVNSFPAVDISADGTVYVAWNSEVNNGATTYGADPVCAYFISGRASVYANCHSSTVWSTSTDGGSTWSAPAPTFPALDSATQTAIGYPVTQPDGSMLNAPTPHHIETIYPAVAVAPNGNVYMSAYAADVVSPWQTCATPASPVAVGRINCLALGSYIHNARLDYIVTDLTTQVTQTMTGNPINTRSQFGGGFIGDYTQIAVGSDGTFHAVWTDTNNQQSVVWWYGFQFVPTTINQEDIATASGNF
jgi:hypothetical protein